MLEQPPQTLKSPWNSPKAQGALGLMLGLAFSIPAMEAETLTWLRGLELAAGLVLIGASTYTLLAGAGTRVSKRRHSDDA